MRCKVVRKRYIIKYDDMFVIVCFLIGIFTYLTYKKIDKNITPILINYAINETTKISTSIINKSVQDSLNDFENANDLYRVIKNKNDEIISIEYNSVNLNRALVNITNSMQKNLVLLEKGKYDLLDIVSKNIVLGDGNKNIVYYIPFGIVSDIPVIADLGPKIPVKVSLIGSSTSNLKTELEEYGINNVLMKVYIVANVNIQVILPFATETTTITEEIPLAINLVNGIIPQVYGGGYFASSPIVSSK